MTIRRFKFRALVQWRYVDLVIILLRFFYFKFRALVRWRYVDLVIILLWFFNLKFRALVRWRYVKFRALVRWRYVDLVIILLCFFNFKQHLQKHCSIKSKLIITYDYLWLKNRLYRWFFNVFKICQYGYKKIRLAKPYSTQQTVHKKRIFWFPYQFILKRKKKHS